MTRTSFATPVVTWSGADHPDAPLVVLLHGRGSTESGIQPLAALLPGEAAYAAVRAPIAEGDGYAWFANRGIGRPLAESLAETMSWFRDWLDETSPPGRPVILVGFSGGAAFAGGLMLSDPGRYSGGAILYGTLPFDAGVPVVPGRLLGMPVFLALGTDDTVIPEELQQRTWDYLLGDSGAPVIARRDSGGHQLSGHAVAALDQWLARRLHFLHEGSPSPRQGETRWSALPDGWLPPRRGGRPTVSYTMPQQQESQNAPAELQEALFERIRSLPGVTTAASAISVPGARAFLLAGNSAAATRETFIVPEVGEFAHLHPAYDGSLHAALPTELAHDAVAKGWATPHPLASVCLTSGMVMIFGPRDETELDVVTGIVRTSYDYARGTVPPPEILGRRTS